MSSPPSRHPISIRPTAAQLAWLRQQRTARGLAINALIILAIEAFMQAEQAADQQARPR
jgi:hypothetical protein